MNKNIVKIGLITLFAFSAVGCSNKKDDNKQALATMANQTVNINEAYQQARVDSQAQGFFDVANARLLKEKYSYEKNAKVKDAVDKQIKEIEKNNPDILKEYGMKDMMELMVKSGSLLTIQEEQYVKDVYEKDFITNKSLKELYDNREGELTSYHVIKVGDADFEGDPAKVEAAKKEINGKLKDATKENVKGIFEELAKTYPGADESNGAKDSVNRSEVESEEVLEKIDKMNYLGFTRTGLEVGEDTYYLLKTDNAERLSFEASRERLRTLQYENATQNNPSLSDYLLAKLRDKNKVSLLNKVDQDVYDQATKKIMDDYKKNEEAKDGDQ